MKRKMSRHGFVVGDRVIAVDQVDGNSFCVGLHGTVREIGDYPYDVLVEFDKTFKGGHNGSARYVGRDDSCRWGASDNFTFEDAQSVSDVKNIKLKVSYEDLLS